MDIVFRGIVEVAFLTGGIMVVLRILLHRHEKHRSQAAFMFTAGVVNDAVFCSFHQAVQGGKLANYYDADLFHSDPDNVGMVLRWFKEKLGEHCRSVGGIDRLIFLENEDGPVGTLTLKDLLTWETKIPSAIIRSSRKGPTLRIKVLKDELRKKPQAGYRAQDKPFVTDNQPEHVVVINSVVTTGTTVINAVDVVEKSGGKVDGIFVLYSRSERYETKGGEKLSGAERVERELNIPVVAMIRAEDLLKGWETVEELTEAAKEQITESAKKKGIIPDDTPEVLTEAR